jgi:hypothetical protein
VFPSTEIRVLERSSDRLVILDPPFYTTGMLFLACAVVVLAITFTFRGHPRRNAAIWATAAAALPCAVVGLVMLTSQTTVTFDGPTNRILIARRLFWFTRLRSGLDLSDVNSAVVIDGVGRQKGLHYLCLLLRSGDAISLGNYTSQSGHYAAADAINDFLKTWRPSRR